MSLGDYLRLGRTKTAKDEHLENIRQLLAEVKTVINADKNIKAGNSYAKNRLGKYPSLLSEKLKILPRAVGRGGGDLRENHDSENSAAQPEAGSEQGGHKPRTIREIAEDQGGKITRFKTGIPGFDRLLKEGIPQGNSVLVEGGPGSGKTIFCLQIANNACKKGLKTLYMSFEEPERRLKYHMKCFGWNPEEYENKGLLIIRRFNALDIARSVEALLSEAKRELLIDVQPVLIPKGFTPDIVCVDSLSSIASAFSGEESRFRVYMEQLFRYFESRGITSFLIRETINPTHIGTMYVEKGEVVSFLSDGIIVLYNAIYSDRRRSRAIEVLKMRGDNISRRIVLAEIIDGKGFVVYPEEQVDGSYILT